MKPYKFLIAIFLTLGIALNASSQAVDYVKAESGKLVAVGSTKRLTTLDSIATTIDSIVIANNTAGVIEVTVSGSTAAGLGVTGKQIYRYHKASGTLTLSSATQVLSTVVDSGITGATYTFAAAGNNVRCQVMGRPSTTFKWKSLVQVHMNY